MSVTNVVEDPDYFDFDSDATIPTDKLPATSSPNFFSQFVSFIKEHYANTYWTAKMFTYGVVCIRVAPLLVHFGSLGWRRLLGQ